MTELLLGQGSSDPDECRQNGVTESVDAIAPAGTVQHALLILNGRCTGPAPEQQLQLQYQLMRAFGRVIGLGWSQVNDNVFTGSPPATNEDIVKWPIMHPIDIVCGPYTYQCLPYPFTLRLDDIASISQLYPIAKQTAPAGKTDTLANADAISGRMSFIAGQGMQGMNVLVRRNDPITPYLEASPVVSAVTGTLFRWSNGSPVTGPPQATVAASMGQTNAALEGRFQLGWIPLLPNAKKQDIYLSSEAINPLYIGSYGIGPYQTAPVAPSGPPFPWTDFDVVPYESNFYLWKVPGSSPTCAAGNLGAAAAPVAAPASGWWTNVLCGYGVSAWPQLAVKADRNLSVEVTALDEQGLVDENKLQPVIGVWGLNDSTGVLPTIAAAVSPFNSIAAGLTLVDFDTPRAGPLRIAISDQRGDGRPDYNFRARILYADSISPVTLPVGGGLVTLTGMGFRAGLQLNIGGIAVPIVGSTANSVLAIAPPFAALPAGTPLTVDAIVNDPMSGGATAIYGALTYPAISIGDSNPTLTVLSPTFYIAAGQTVAISPRVALSIAGAVAPDVPVIWSSALPSLSFPTGTQSVSDRNGIASITATAGPLQPGARIIGSACALDSGQTSGQTSGQPSVCGTFTLIAVDPALWTPTAIEGASQTVVSTSILQPLVLQITDGAADPVIGAPVAIYQEVAGWQVCPPDGRCPIAPVYSHSQSSAISDANGLIVVTPLQLAGTPEVTAIAASTGTQGFLSVPLQKSP